MLFREPETDRVMALVAAEDHVVVSSLARLETLGQIHARVAGGLLDLRGARRLVARLDYLLNHDPYEVVRMPADVMDVAEGQVRMLRRGAYCRTLDRLHLAAMIALALRRLLTNDDAQARAARALDFTVTLPRR